MSTAGPGVVPPAPVLIATKLRVPDVREGSVIRQELISRLVAGANHKLALLCAPAGWGKTMLLSEWCASADEERPFAWVSLDPADDEPVRFWRYVIGALQSVHSDLGEAALATVADAGRDLVDVVLPPLINDLAAVPRQLVLVLDDYHFVRNDMIHVSIAYLLRHLPPGVQLVIATRADPPIPLASMRAAGDVTEIRAAELRFSDAEADALLNGSLELALDPADVELLQMRTEGWAAGLQLAGLSLRGQEDRHAFVEALAGDDRQIGDYLHDVLEDQPPALREFLLRTSILERMCAPLCDAVTANADAVARLDELHRSNVFLIALDAPRHWYRYHHLFRDLLRYELARGEPSLVSELHLRASAWHQANGAADEAIGHAVSAEDWERARELIAQNWRAAVFNPGETEMVARWIDALPRESVGVDVRLCMARAWASLVLGRHNDVAHWLRAAENCPPLSGPLYAHASVESALARLNTEYALLNGDVGLATESSRQELQLEKDRAAFTHALASVALGVALYFASESGEAELALETGLLGLPREGKEASMIAALGCIAAIRAEAGDLERAEQFATEAEQVIADRRFAEAPWTAPAHHARGTLLELRGDSRGAEQAFGRAAQLARRGGWRLYEANALIALARLLRRRRQFGEARAHIRDARAVLASCPDPGMLGELLARTERSLQFARAPASAPTLPVDVELSERELTVLRLLASNLTQREIGSELYVSFNTVKGHTRSIFRKLGVANRGEAVARGRELGLL